MNMGITYLNDIHGIDSIVKPVPQEQQITETSAPVIHFVEVTAPMDVDPWIKEQLQQFANKLTDEEMAFAVVFFSQELDKAQELDVSEADQYEDDIDFDEETE